MMSRCDVEIWARNERERSLKRARLVHCDFGQAAFTKPNPIAAVNAFDVSGAAGLAGGK
jgi:hypothetical protein